MGSRSKQVLPFGIVGLGITDALKWIGPLLQCNNAASGFSNPLLVSEPILDQSHALSWCQRPGVRKWQDFQKHTVSELYVQFSFDLEIKTEG